jgi:hypothetical protein
MALGYLLVRRPYVLAHRGASGYAPENTEAAFDRAIALRSDGIETDVRATKDGVLVPCTTSGSIGRPTARAGSRR